MGLDYVSLIQYPGPGLENLQKVLLQVSGKKKKISRLNRKISAQITAGAWIYSLEKLEMKAKINPQNVQYKAKENPL